MGCLFDTTSNKKEEQNMKRNIKNSRRWKRLFSGVMVAAMLAGCCPACRAWI